MTTSKEDAKSASNQKDTPTPTPDKKNERAAVQGKEDTTPNTSKQNPTSPTGAAITDDATKEAGAQPKAPQPIDKASTPQKTPAETVPPKDFDWSAFDKKGFGEGYADEERKEMTQLYTNTITSIAEGEVVEGTITSINDRDVTLNIGFKSDGLVPRSEFKDLPEMKVGDTVDLFVEMREDALGQLVLSRKKAKLVKSWNIIQRALEDESVMESLVKRRTKGGLIVDLCGIEAFLPGSQIDVKPIRDFNIYVGKTIEVKVIKINYINNNIVVSHKILIEKDIEEQKAAILNNLEKGQVLEGVIKNMTNFGVFIDLGGVDGLLHITDIAWERVNHPSEVLKLDQVVKVVVLDFDEPKKRISLGMKQLVPHPWSSLPEDLDVKSKVKGKITNIVDYGAFLEILPGVEGLIHISEMSWSQHLRNPQDILKVGDELEAVVLTIDREERKMSLGIKQLKADPWTKQDLLAKYAVGTKHTGVVRNLTNFGLFVELEEGIDGLVHISDLSWSKAIKHPNEFTKAGDKLEVVVLEIEVSMRRLSLSHKHIEENPWETFESVFTPGSIHPCMVLEKKDRGATLELPYGVETFCSNDNLVQEDGKTAEVGSTLDCKVIEFSSSERRVVVSHRATWDKAKKAEQKEPRKGKGKAKKRAGDRSFKKGRGEEPIVTENMKSLRMIKEKMQGKKKDAEDAQKE